MPDPSTIVPHDIEFFVTETLPTGPVRRYQMTMHDSAREIVHEGYLVVCHRAFAVHLMRTLILRYVGRGRFAVSA